MEFSEKIYKKKENLVARRIGEEYILVPIVNNIAEMNKVYTLNEMGAFIWDQIDGVKTIQDIIFSITATFEVNSELASIDLQEFIKKSENIIIN